MSLGKCLLLSNCTGNIDLVKRGVNGEIFNNQEEAINHIIYFYLNKEITESMGLNSLEICRDYFSIEETAFRYRMEYKKIPENKPKSEELNVLEDKRRRAITSALGRNTAKH